MEDIKIDMTNQEAIKALQEFALNYGLNDKMIDAFGKAIRALEEQPCNDCISREALLAKIDAERKYLLDLKMDGAEHIVVHHARRIIEDMPPVIPQPKVWKWTKTYEPNDAEPFILWKCECCGLPERIKTHYCPSCGARMEVEE